MLDATTNHDALDASTSDVAQAGSNGDATTNHDALDASTYDVAPVRVIALDWERDGWRVSHDGAPAVHVSKEDLLTEPFADSDYVVVEQPHVRERNDYSVAQVYTLDELRGLACAAKIRLFPAKTTYRASEFAGNLLDTTDVYGRRQPDKSKDAESIAIFAAGHPNMVRGWKRFVLPENDPARLEWPRRDALREDIQRVLNPLRVAWNQLKTSERYELPVVRRLCDLLDAEYERLTPGVREQYGIRRSRNGIRVERMSSAVTVFLCVRNEAGELRLNDHGGFIGWRFIARTVGLSHSHTPNMARSQLTHHGMRHYKGGRDGGHRSEYMRNMRNFVAVIRDASQDATTIDDALDASTKHVAPGWCSTEEATA